MAELLAVVTLAALALCVAMRGSRQISGDEPHADLRTLSHQYVSEWVHLLRAANDRLNDDEARIQVHAALTIANNGARTPSLRQLPHFAEALESVCKRVLELN